MPIKAHTTQCTPQKPPEHAAALLIIKKARGWARLRAGRTTCACEGKRHGEDGYGYSPAPDYMCNSRALEKQHLINEFVMFLILFLQRSYRTFKFLHMRDPAACRFFIFNFSGRRRGRAFDVVRFLQACRAAEVRPGGPRIAVDGPLE